MRFAIAVLPGAAPLPVDPSLLDAADHWSHAAAHAGLRQALEAQFDGYAVAFRQSESLSTVWDGVDTAQWERLEKGPGDERARRRAEMLAYSSPRPTLYAPVPTLHVRGTLLTPSRTVRPRAWYDWVFALLGALPGTDEVVDYFTGEPVPHFTDLVPLELDHPVPAMQAS